MKAFDALHAPLLIDSIELQKRVLATPLAHEMLDSLEPLGLVGITILTGPMRKPLGVEPLVGPADYRGKTIGMAPSTVGDAAFATLGARGKELTDAFTEDLAGIEQNVESIVGNEYETAGKFLTANVNLWPRPLVVFMNRTAYEELNRAQRAALKTGAQAGAIRSSTLQANYSDEYSSVLCRRGVTFVKAGPEELSALRRAFEPVYDQLARDAFTRASIAMIRDLKKEVSAPPDAPPCDNVGSRASARKATPIDGHYRMKSTADDLRKAGAAEGDIHSDNYGVWETILDRGRFSQKQPNDAAAEGTYEVEGDLVTFTVTAGKPGRFSETRAGEVYTFRWSRYRDFLKLAPGPDRNSPPTWLVKPWRRLGDAPRTLG